MQAFERHLESISSAVERGDFDAFCKRMSLPCVVISGARTAVLRSSAGLRAHFHELSRQMGAKNAPKVRATSMSILDAGLVGGTFRVEEEGDPHQGAEARSGFMMLRHNGETWKTVVLTENTAMAENRTTIEALASMEDVA